MYYYRRSGLLSLLAGLALVIAVVGFARGWFELSSARNESAGKMKVELNVDTEKVEQDAEKTKEFADKVVDDAREGVERAIPPAEKSPK